MDSSHPVHSELSSSPPEHIPHPPPPSHHATLPSLILTTSTPTTTRSDTPKDCCYYFHHIHACAHKTPEPHWPKITHVPSCAGPRAGEWNCGNLEWRPRVVEEEKCDRCVNTEMRGGGVSKDAKRPVEVIGELSRLGDLIESRTLELSRLKNGIQLETSSWIYRNLELRNENDRLRAEMTYRRYKIRELETILRDVREYDGGWEGFVEKRKAVLRERDMYARIEMKKRVLDEDDELLGGILERLEKALVVEEEDMFGIGASTDVS